MPIVFATQNKDGRVLAPLSIRAQAKYQKTKRAITERIHTTIEKTDSLWQSFLDLLSSLMSRFRRSRLPRAVNEKGHPRRDALCRPVYQLPVTLTLEAPPQVSSLVIPTAGETPPPTPAPASPLDPLQKLAHFHGVDQASFVQAQLSLFFQALGIQKDDQGGVARSLQEILTQKLSLLWNRCIDPITMESNPDGYKQTVRSLHTLRTAYAQDSSVLRVTNLVKGSLDKLTPKDGRPYRIYRGDLTEAFDNLYRIHLQ